MKTTKEIAEIFCAEIDRIGRGEIRQDVITALEKCSNSLINLARLEMDFARFEWNGNEPKVPWLASQSPAPIRSVPTPTPAVLTARTTAGQSIERDIQAIEKQLAGNVTGTMKTILNDKLKHLGVKLSRVEAQADEQADE